MSDERVCAFGPAERAEFAYGEMDPKRAEVFASHLEDCPECEQAVAELKAFAELTRRVVAQPEPQLNWSKALPALPKPKRAWWRLPQVWVPAACGAFALLVALTLIGLTDAPAVPSEMRPETFGKPAVAKVAPAGQQVAVDMAVRVQAADGSAPRELLGPIRLQLGDRILAAGKNPVSITSKDGSQLRLEAGSSLRLAASAGRAQRWELQSGSVVCQVTPRPAHEPFRVQAGPGLVTVKGTRFAVRLDSSDSLTVAVAEGLVSVTPLAGGAAIELGAGQQTCLRRGQPASVAASDGSLDSLLKPEALAAVDPLAPEPERLAAQMKPRKKRRKVKAVLAVADSKPTDEAPAAELAQPSVEPPFVVDPGPGPGLERAALLASLKGNSNWMFDGIRKCMTRGDYEGALLKLGNYLSDPDSPDPGEASYLKAICLEQLGRTNSARAEYEHYLKRWPKGGRASEASAGLNRTR